MGRSMMDVGSGPAGGKGREYGAVRGEEEGLPGRAQVRYGLRPRLYSPLAAAGEPQCSMCAALLHIAEGHCFTSHTAASMWMETKGSSSKAGSSRHPPLP